MGKNKKSEIRMTASVLKQDRMLCFVLILNSVLLNLSCVWNSEWVFLTSLAFFQDRQWKEVTACNIRNALTAKGLGDMASNPTRHVVGR